jgi:hypothetical protein
MVETKVRLAFRSKPGISTAIIVLILLAVFVQVVHVHVQCEPSGTTCLACMSAHTAVPVTAFAGSVLLIAITLVLVHHQPGISHCEATLPLFIRPPPTR